jgi:hypothetical protein
MGMPTISHQDFTASIGQEPEPAGLTPVLQAIRHGLRGEWELAHGIVQRHEGDKDADWVHAWLHRVEGDLSNAGYWYRRAGRTMATVGTDEEGRFIAAELIAR